MNKRAAIVLANHTLCLGRCVCALPDSYFPAVGVENGNYIALLKVSLNAYTYRRHT